MGGGAWPFLVGEVICLVNSVNERDPCLLNSAASESSLVWCFLEGRASTRRRKIGAITGL